MAITFSYWTLPSALTITGKSGVAAFCAAQLLLELGHRHRHGVEEGLPGGVDADHLGLRHAPGSAAELAFGRSTLMPCTAAVVMMMNITSST